MIQSLPQVIILIFSIVFHEVAHGYVALRRGDTTARDAGRLTLNPIPHIDLFGTILFPLLLIITRSPVLFGWAKPVPVNPFRLKEMKKSMGLVSLAGPASNLILAVAVGIVFRLVLSMSPASQVVLQALYYAVFINVVLAVFNLVPVPPLDGSKILMSVLPDEYADRIMQLERYGFVIIFLLLFLGLFRLVVLPIASVLVSMIIGI